MHICRYAAYEATALKRLDGAARGLRGEEVDQLLRTERMMVLYDDFSRGLEVFPATLLHQEPGNLVRGERIGSP